MRRVIKIGGSLLLRTNLVTRLPVRIDELGGGAASETLVMVGGGEMIDAIRRLDRCRPLDPIATHWQCIELLQQTLEIFHQWFPSWNRIDTRAELEHAIEQGFPTDRPSLVSVEAFYRRDVPADLPMDWRTTSDSLASLLATLSGSDELVLVKSCQIDDGWTTASLMDKGIIDAAFPWHGASTWRLRVEAFAPEPGPQR
ncbi:amino acid kinase family protein [Novipirellula artificiosorum]|uniref:Amino acid kinase family protein n=1 Tax=Novipirellula artificiosorum TaxID=2528016 RepID=A0A5C6D099_9BACT|nr:hypothetical protein [Novipirellula artificiosorum]TWU30553.1 hypothetical protein Poly41_66480 [Novipirellula artificiosorum]